MPIESFLALALLTTTRPAASMYTLASTHAGAAILWIGAELFTFLALIPVFVQWLRFEGRQDGPHRRRARRRLRRGRLRTSPRWVPTGGSAHTP